MRTTSSVRTVIAIGKSCEQTADGHENASDHDGKLAAKVVRHVGREQKGDNGADVEHVDQAW